MRSPILLLHILAGTLGMLSGFVAVFLRKGSRRHGIAGKVFVIAMLSLSASGVYLAIMKSQPGNILGGTLTFYLVGTAWMTARRTDNAEPGIFDWGALLVVLAVAASQITFGLEAAFRDGAQVRLSAVALLFHGFSGSARGHRGRSHAGAQRHFRRTTDRTASLAHVLCAVHRRIVHLSGAATHIPRDITKNGSPLFPEFPATAVNDFLDAPGSLHKRIQIEIDGYGGPFPGEKSRAHPYGSAGWYCSKNLIRFRRTYGNACWS